MLEKYYSSAVEAEGSFWLALERGGVLSIHVYAVPDPVPPVAVNTTAAALTVHVDVEGIPRIDPLKDFQVLLYTPDARLCNNPAGLALHWYTLRRGIQVDHRGRHVNHRGRPGQAG